MLLDEILESYISKKVTEKVINILNELADVLEDKIKYLCLDKADEISLIETIHQLRSYRK